MKKPFKVLSLIIFILLIAVLCRFIPVSVPGSSNQDEISSSSPAPQQDAQHSPLPDADKQDRTDYSAIPAAIMPRLTEADRSAYKAVVRAYFNYETEAEFSAGDEIRSLKQLLELCCPIFYNDVDEASVKISGNKICWEYSDSEAEHNENIAVFTGIINEYLDYADEADNDITKALMLYKRFCTLSNYDHPTEDYLKGEAPRPDRMRDKCIDIFLNGSGICQCFARGYAFLLNQAGIEAFTAGADGGVGHHEWTVLKLGGKWYYADPTWDKGGKNLYYFGMTADRRSIDGYKLKNTYYFAGGDFPIADDFDITDTKFKPLYTGHCSGDTYEINTKNNMIIVYRRDAEGKLCQYEKGTFYINAN